MKGRRKLDSAVAAALGAIAIFGATDVARAQLYWDINGANAGATDDAGGVASGTWDGVTLNWSTDSTGASATQAYVADSSVVFSAGTNATGASAITVAGTQTAAGITFKDGDVTLTGGQIDLVSPATLQVDAATARIDSVLGGAAGLDKTGTGILTLGGVNTNTGLHTVTAGTLRLGAAGVIDNAASVTVAGGATLDLNGFSETISTLAGAGNVTLGSGTLTLSSANPSTFSGGISGTGGLANAGTGTFTLSGANTYGGATTVTTGTIQAGAVNAFSASSAHTVAAGATLDLNNFDNTVASIAGAGSISMGTGNLTSGGANTNTTFSGVISGSGRLVKTGTGNLTLSGLNTFTGGIDFNGGLVIISGETSGTAGAANRLGATPGSAVANYLRFDGGTLRNTTTSAAGTGSFAFSQRGTTILAGGGTFDLSSAAAFVNYAGIINNSSGGRWTKSGPGTLRLQANMVGSATSSIAVTGGRLMIDSNLRFGTQQRVILDGGTLHQTNTGNAGSFISSSAILEIGPNGGTVQYDDGSATNNFTTIYTGTIQGTGGTPSNGGVGTLTKTGPDFFGYTAGHSNTSFAKLNVIQGIFQARSTTGSNETTFGAVPLSELTDAITLNGGGIGASFSTTLNAFRGITIGANGGTFNNNGLGTITVPGPFTSAGGNTLTIFGRNLTTTSNTFGNSGGGLTLSNVNNVNTFQGTSLVIDSSTLTLNESLNLASLSGASQTATGGTGPTSGPVAASQSGATTVGTIAIAAAKTLTVGSNNADTSYSGRVNGAGTFTKVGTGTLTLNTINATATFIIGGATTTTFSGEWSNTGGVNINDGTIKFGNADSGFASTAPVTINSPGVLDMNSINDTFGSLAGNGSVINNSGASGLTLAGTDSTNFSGSIGGTAKVTINKASGVQTFSGANTYTGGTVVNAGTLVVGHGDALAGGAIDVKDGALAQVQAGVPKAVTVSTLATNATGKFDVTDNSMVVKGMTDAQVRTQLQAGYNGGAWNGPTGIVSSAVNSSTSVGYASNTSLGLTEFKGVSGLAGSDVMVKYTYAGDANLDGKVDIGDLGLLAGAWQQLTDKVWFDGDFTYDGAVNIGDLGLLAGNWQKGTVGNPNPPLMDFNTALAQFSAFNGVAVPEPTGLALLGAAGIGLLARRRRRA